MSARDSIAISFARVARKLKSDGPVGLAAAAARRVFGTKGNEVDENAMLARMFHGDENKVMVDVGACHGQALLPFAQRGWRIIAFEPDPQNRKILLHETRNLPRVVVSPQAVTEVDDEILQFYASPESFGISSLTPFSDSHRPVAQVETTRLDTFLRAKRIDIVDYLKVDAEGHDLFVLRSFPFSTALPSVILCEFEDRKTIRLGYKMTDLADFLVKKGYMVIVSEWQAIVRYGGQHVWRRFARYPTPLVDPNGWGNLVAVRGEAFIRSAEALFLGA